MVFHTVFVCLIEQKTWGSPGLPQKLFLVPFFYKL